MTKINKVAKIFLSFSILITGLTSLTYLAINKDSIKELISNQSKKNESKSSENKEELDKVKQGQQDKKWALNIQKGGYILFFRHTEREKWIDVEMYDSLESDLHENGLNGTRFAENEYFEKAVCLNSRGKVQAKAMEEVIKYSKLPIGEVISSPSCRARQTAEMVFGGYDKLNRNLVHTGPYSESKKEKTKYLRNFLKNIKIKEGKNTIISAHNSVIHSEIFKMDKEYLKLEEGGFYIISNKNSKLELVHEFNNFLDYSKVFFPRDFKF